MGLDLGFIEIKYYSILMLCAILLGVFLIKKESKRFNINQEFMFNLLFWVIICGIIGARIYYVSFEWDSYKNNLIDIFKIWEGGIAIHGGIIGGLIALIIYTVKYKIKIFKITDIMVPALLLGQAIGRWGNFFNHEAYGPAVTYSFLKNLHLPNFIIDGMHINGIYYQPTFLYESIWNILGVILLLILRRTKYIKTGILTSIYLVWYGIGRFFIEGLRGDSLMFFDIRIAQVISILFIVVGLIIFVFNIRGSKLDNLYNKEEKEMKF